MVHGGPDTLHPDQATLDLTPNLPGLSVCSFVHAIWPGVRTMEWRAVEVHSSAQRDAGQYGSAVLPRRHRHILVFSKMDMLQQPFFEPVMVEIRWPTTDGVRSVTAFGFWMPQVTAIPTFLARLGFLRACTLSHRCSIHHNGRYVAGVQMSLVDGDFLVLEGFVMDIPADSDDEVQPDPQPVRQPRAETSSPTTSDVTDTVMASSPSVESDDDSLPPDLTVLIYRPRGPLGRPLQATVILRERIRSFHRPCLAHWPDLAGKPWTSFRVHPSYNLAFPQHEIAEHYVIRDPTEAGPRMTTLVMVSASRTLFLHAMSLSSPTSRLQILTAVGLQRICPVHYRNCLTYINEVSISATDRCVIYDGAFIRVDITGLRRTMNYEALSDLFDVTNDDLGMEHVEHHGIALFTRPSGNLVITSPPTRGTPCQRREHASYWICAAWFCNVVLGSLLRGLCHDCRKPSAQGVSRKQLRFERKERSIRLRWRKSLFLTYLILHGQCEPCTGLLLRYQTASGVDSSFDPSLQDGPGHLHLYDAEWKPDPLLHLPPPGNPLQADDDLLQCELRSLLTPYGHKLLQDLAFWVDCKSTQWQFQKTLETLFDQSPQVSLLPVEETMTAPMTLYASPISCLWRMLIWLEALILQLYKLIRNYLFSARMLALFHPFSILLLCQYSRVVSLWRMMI